jgi:hypothetical protein
MTENMVEIICTAAVGITALIVIYLVDRYHND